MKIKHLLRPALAVILGFFGAFIARAVSHGTIFAVGPEYFLVIVAIMFATLGFIMPDILELAGKAGIAALATQIVGYLPARANIALKRRSKALKAVNVMIVDTSALIDGRLIEVARTGFLYGTLIVIPAVISELHKLSDNADDAKRARGRLGLENLSELQKIKSIKVEIASSDPAEKGVDEMLLALGKKLNAKVVTVDYNLNKVAKVKGITILNVNELANAVKTVVLPNEAMSIQITTAGKEKDQGVGYLSDGTMVVVSGGAKHLGHKIDVKVLRVLQTVAGKMIFGEIV